MKKRLIITIAILVIVFGAIFGYHLFTEWMIAKYIKNMTPPPATVSVITVHKQNWQSSIQAAGTVAAVQGTDISPQVAGIVKTIQFQSGQMIKKGDILITLDTAVLDAEVAGYLAAMRLDQLTYARDQRLFALGAISHADLDTAETNLKQAKATLDQYQALVAQNVIRAPFAGKVGIRQVDLGQYITAGTVITNIQTINPIYINFNIAQEDLPKIRAGETVEVTASTYPGIIFTGKINAIDAKVSSNTEAVAVQAQVANNKKNALLKPGMFVNVRVLSALQKEVVVVPQTVINYTLYGDTAMVVKNSTDKAGKAVKTVKAVNVTVGEQHDNQAVILEGLKDGDVVVSFGQVKLRDGAEVLLATHS